MCVPKCSSPTLFFKRRSELTYKTIDKISYDRTMTKSARVKKLEGYVYTVMKIFKKSKTATLNRRCWLQAVYIVREAYKVGKGDRG